MQRSICFCLILLIPLSLAADSLWDEQFKGYLAGSGRLNVGDIVNVRIDTASNLKIKAQKDDKERITLELSGGESGSLFDFLPGGSAAGSQDLRANEEYSFQSTLATRVLQIDDRGIAFIQGSKQINMMGFEESLTISGWINPADLDQGNSLNFDQLAEGKISYLTMLDPAQPVLSDEDIQTISRELAAAETGPVSETVDAAGAEQPAAVTLALSAEKKRKLLLFYLNRLLDLVFDSNRL